jgi:stage IV sporulation protein B
MSKGSSKKKKLILFTLTGIISIIVLSPFFMATIFFPKEIHLIKGQEHVFKFNIPIEANVLGEDKLVLKINDQPVSENINIDLSKQFSIKSDESGIINVQLKLFGVIPLKVVKVDVLSNVQLVPCGNTIGVRISTDGVMVLGTGQVNSEDGKAYEPGKGVIKSGDLILQANHVKLNTKEQLIEQIESCNGSNMDLEIKRDEEMIQASIQPIKSIDDKTYKIGVWVRDSTQGIGTVTYYNPQTGNFGALGHGILDVDTNQLMSVRQGDITASKITSVKKGKKGSPGELVGNIIGETVLGNIKVNTQYGIYGLVNNRINSIIQKQTMAIGIKQEVHEGKATILTNIIDNEIRSYEINIQSVNKYNTDDSKGMIIKITDETLLKDTNGIVQGMSGSPIIQDGKLIGAVTHVFVQDPTKGYGIFIENMLKQEEKIK